MHQLWSLFACLPRKKWPDGDASVSSHLSFWTELKDLEAERFEHSLREEGRKMKMSLGSSPMTSLQIVTPVKGNISSSIAISSWP